ncbi:hypothetical protein E3N88_42641 [Mikania micrantha]|uniref:Reverse transcriptase Ty1/copia-type domain-containing protein n=1 Tax=Mikania micrantha TaxID=192012 RepID=A0A5N6LHA9_9ASTR|nr:hypothetical protein E3N88_42641 [Mikania micrantha]
MEAKIEMSDLGLLSYYLGLEVKQSRTGMTAARWMPQITGKSLCLRYLTHARPDLAYSVGYVSRYMQNPKLSHYQAVKYILRYVKGRMDLGIHYRRNGRNGSNCYLGLVTVAERTRVPCDYDQDDGKGTTGVVFYFDDGPIAWISQKQSTVALSSCEAEFMAANLAAFTFDTGSSGVLCQFHSAGMTHFFPYSPRQASNDTLDDRVKRRALSAIYCSGLADDPLAYF